jgi:hypothetical protein
LLVLPAELSPCALFLLPQVLLPHDCQCDILLLCLSSGREACLLNNGFPLHAQNVGALTGQIGMVYAEKYVGFWLGKLAPVV